MPIGTPASVATISSSSSATSYASSSFTPTSTKLYIAFIGSGKTTTPDTPTLTGNSLTWTNLTTIVSGDSTRRLTAFAANGLGGTAGTATADFGGNTQTSCRGQFLEITGCDLASVATSPGTGKSIVQAPSAGDSGTGTTATVTLAAAGASTNRNLTAFLIKSVGTDIVPRTNWTEINELAQLFEVQWRSDAFETTSTATWTGSSRWCCIGLELKVGQTDFVGMIPIF